jgi:hypothetical protein
MLITTAGDYRFRDLVAFSERKIQDLGYVSRIYDLGGLGPGVHHRLPFDLSQIPFPQLSEEFVKNGHYEEVRPGWLTRALHKPFLLLDCLGNTSGHIVYLDGDAFLLARIDEVAADDYDLGVVLRPEGERTGHPDMAGIVNAGVLFLANTSPVRDFMRRWCCATIHLRNDQLALNRLLFPAYRLWQEHPEGGWIFRSQSLPEKVEIDGLVVRFFDSRYNCYVDPFPGDARIIHFKGILRQKLHRYLEAASSKQNVMTGEGWPKSQAPSL